MSSPFYRLDEIAVAVATGSAPEASATVYVLPTGESRTASATGDGPVDALFHAIDQAAGALHELDSYSIRSVAEGSDAVGEVTVLLRFGEASFRGVASNTDVLQASADAYIAALNRMEAFKVDQENVKFVGAHIIQSFQGGETT